jgi:hypothetical protein
MPKVKQAVIIGSIAAGAFLAVTGRRGAGALLAGVGLAVLASEHPEKVEELIDRAPEYLQKGTQVMNVVSGFLERIAEHQQRRAESPYVV